MRSCLRLTPAHSQRPGSSLRVNVLGPIQLRIDGETTLLSNCERALLGCLVARRDRHVSRDSLIDAVWPIQAPESARKTLQGLVLRVRKIVGSDVIITSEGGYHLNSEMLDLDVSEFKRLVDLGGEAVRTGQSKFGVELLERAVRLWRGEPYGNLGETCVAVPERRWLEEIRCNAAEMLAAGFVLENSTSSAVAVLERLVAEEPLRESAWVGLAAALVSGGRHAEALAVCARARRVLIEELGAGPGGALKAMESDLVAAKRVDALWSDPIPSCREGGSLLLTKLRTEDFDAFCSHQHFSNGGGLNG
jgi:DNA-binding SARP family transcriptional activator